MDNAPDQVKAYAEHFSSCQVIAVSNGYCYKTYRRTKDGFSTTPDAYLNILRPQDRYPLDPKAVDGCLAVLRHLLPHSWSQGSQTYRSQTGAIMSKEVLDRADADGALRRAEIALMLEEE